MYSYNVVTVSHHLSTKYANNDSNISVIIINNDDDYGFCDYCGCIEC